MKGNECLNKFLSLNECNALNVEDEEVLKTILSSTSTIKSNEDDPQILITLKFIQNVNITHIQIESGMNSDEYPAFLKIFNGRNDLDFDDVQEMQATEKFELLKNLGKPIRVNIPRFKNVSIMTVSIIYIKSIYIQLFFYSNDASQIQLNSIKFFGNGGTANIDFGELKKNPVT